MNRLNCLHGVILPKGLICNHGYLTIRLMSGVFGKPYFKNFGPHTRANEEIAVIHLNDKRKEVLMGKAGIPIKIPQKKFKDVCDLFMPLWIQERDANGCLMHGEYSIKGRENMFTDVLIPYFGPMMFDEINTQDIEQWRTKLILDRGISGTTVNRYQVPLSAIFTSMIKWVEAGKIKPAFKLPAKNPCLSATWAKIKIRERLFTEYELRKLKFAFQQLNDLDGWEICKFALKSVLSLKDLKSLKMGQSIQDLKERSKTGVALKLPITVLVKLNWTNWRLRWIAARDQAGLVDAQFRDLRKTGINMLTGKHDQKLVSQFAGHASVKTTEQIYQLRVGEKLKPLADDLDLQVEAL